MAHSEFKVGDILKYNEHFKQKSEGILTKDKIEKKFKIISIDNSNDPYIVFRELTDETAKTRKGMTLSELNRHFTIYHQLGGKRRKSKKQRKSKRNVRKNRKSRRNCY